VIVTSEARYTDGNWREMPEASRPPSSYKIDLYKVTTSWRRGDRPVEPTQQYQVDKSETAAWYHLDEGSYYVVIHKGGNPNFTLRGELHLEVRSPESERGD
jgi:hypothetical protein